MNVMEIQLEIWKLEVKNTLKKTATRLNIFINMPLIKKKCGSNIDENTKKKILKNEASGFMNRKPKSKIKKLSWKAIKDHISSTKGSMTSKNFKLLLTNLTHSLKPSYWRFMESMKYVAEERDTFLPKNRPSENTDLLEAERC